MSRRFTRLPKERLAARIFLNLKGSKKKRDDWITIAQLVQEWVRRHDTTISAAEELGASPELVRSIISLLTLPKEVQRIIVSEGMGFDAAQRLARVSGAARQTEIAKAVTGLSSHDARQVILFSKNNPNAHPEEFKNRVVNSKAKRDKLTLVIVPLPEDLRQSLSAIARERGSSLSALLVDAARQLADRSVEARQ